MYSLSDQQPVPFIIYSVQMAKHKTNGVTLMPDSISTKSQEIIGLLNQLHQDIGQSDQQLIPTSSCLDFKMKEMVMNSMLEPILVTKKETNGLSMDLMDDYYKSSIKFNTFLFKFHN